MNLTDFVDTIKVSVRDLEYTNQHGYAKGISNIFTKHLADMAVTDRPIHCSDKKRLQFYIKDDDKWGKDVDHEKIEHTIRTITKKQILQLKEWEKENPNYLENDALTRTWHQMIFNMTGENNAAKINVNIKKSLSDNVGVKELING